MTKQKALKKRANLRDVASAAGVSVATVSRAINAPETVAEKTRLRIEEASNKLRWAPSAAARAINTGRSRFVGALVPTLDGDIFAPFLASMESRIGRHRLSLVVATTNDDPEVELQKAKELIDIGAEGLIISGLTHHDALCELIEWRQLPTIAISCFDPDYFLPTIGYNNKAAARSALLHLEKLGHRNVAVLHGPSKNNDRTRARLAGLQDHESEIELNYFDAPVTVAGGCAAADQVLKSATRPTAFLCLSDVLATGALFELQRQGLRVPEEISVIGLDDLPSSAHLYPELTAVHLPVRIMGRAAADAIAAWVEDAVVPKANLLDFSLVIRQSTSAVA